MIDNKHTAIFLFIFCCIVNFKVTAQNVSLNDSVTKKSQLVVLPNYLKSIVVSKEWKLSPNLKKSDSIDETGCFVIKVWNIEIFKNEISTIPNVKILSLYTGGNELIIETTYKCLFTKIVQMDNVIYVELHSSIPKEESEVIDHNLTINKVNQLFHNYAFINGKGITVSIKENNYDTADIDLKGRQISSSLSGPYISKHTTDMASIIAGGGNSSYQGKGVAWGADITSSYFLNLLPDENNYFDKYSVSVQNHSYGTNVESFYGAITQAYDICANHNPYLVHVFSVGNSGEYTDTTGPYEGVSMYANITGSYKQAKNIITIGSVDLSYAADPKVSRGPAYDGRVKPELVAYSTFGSSNSAAIVSGIVALLQEAYKEDNVSILPPSALIKAVLINSAEDVGPKGMDFLTGYGNVNAFRAMKTLKGNQYFHGTLSQNEEKQFDLSIPENIRNLKITLVWNDPAADLAAPGALVNDLDLLLLQNNTGNSWKPWVLNHYPQKDSLQQLPQRKEDRLNNAEQITVDNPESGIYKIKVSAYDLPGAPQEFFVAYQWDMADSFLWTFPTGTDNFLYYDNGLNSFRWESTFPDNEKGQLEISADQGNTWELIADTISLSAGNYYWQVPETFTPAMARMLINGKTYYTDTFTISSPREVDVGFNCGDSVMLQWNRVNKATSYTLYSLGEIYMEPIKTITDTEFILKKDNYPTKLFAVAPNFSPTLSGIRSPAYNYDLQGVNCYFINFIANNNGAVGIQLTLRLGSTYKISRITFESFNKQQFVPIHIIQNARNINEIYTDDTPLQGMNIYRARLELDNGTSLLSDPDTIYYLTQTPAIVFPNPIRQNETLKIYTKYEAGQSAIFKLFDITGKLMGSYELLSDQESVVLKDIHKGIYVYKLEMKGSVKSGKIMVY